MIETAATNYGICHRRMFVPRNRRLWYCYCWIVLCFRTLEDLVAMKDTKTKCVAFQQPLRFSRRSRRPNVYSVASFPYLSTVVNLKIQDRDGSLSNKDIDKIQTIPSSPWNATLFASTNTWGKHPLLLRGAFLKDIVKEAAVFPSWDDIIDLACVGGADDESCDDEEDFLSDQPDIPSRLIAQTRPGQIDSFELLGFGPFASTKFLKRTLASGQGAASTLVVNDVDRWIPELSDWMDDNFASLLPRWRRDDAQISLANFGGGIGPHVDSYDVFLIQISGTRTWEVGVDYRVSIQEEYDNLVETCSENGVRILNMTNLLTSDDSVSAQPPSTVKIQVEPGDCLYLPPRVTHWGTATSDECMTLSVGCRAPSAADLIARLSETILLDATATSSLDSIHRRYTEENLSVSRTTDMAPADSFISPEVKGKMRNLILEAITQALDDDETLDSLIGKIVTEPNRLGGDASSYPVPLDGMDRDWKYQLGVWGDAERALKEVLVNGKGSLKRAEGISFAWSCLKGARQHRKYRMYAHGRDPVELDIMDNGKVQEASIQKLMNRIANGSPLRKSSLEEDGIDIESQEVHHFLHRLVNEGLLYGMED
jgi:ribosomal protein L16 Arg81 hydroxylase